MFAPSTGARGHLRLEPNRTSLGYARHRRWASALASVSRCTLTPRPEYSIMALSSSHWRHHVLLGPQQIKRSMTSPLFVLANLRQSPLLKFLAGKKVAWSTTRLFVCVRLRLSSSGKAVGSDGWMDLCEWASMGVRGHAFGRNARLGPESLSAG